MALHTSTYDHKSTPEDYNMCSPEREELLKDRLGNSLVHPALWAVCRLADLENLKHLPIRHNIARYGLVRLCEDIITQWSHLSGKDSLEPSADDSGETPFGVGPADAAKCESRDGHQCILTKHGSPAAAVICPFEALHVGKNWRSIDRVWKPLEAFWEEARVNKWKDAIMTDQGRAKIKLGSCLNLFCLNPEAQAMWEKGIFALKPLSLSEDQKELTIQFFWQPEYSHSHGRDIDLLTEATSSEGLTHVGNFALYTDSMLGSNKAEKSKIERIESGQVFTLTTTDPEKRPLPSTNLLEMRWFLMRLVRMSGGIESMKSGSGDWGSESDMSLHDDDDDEELEIGGETAEPAGAVSHLTSEDRQAVLSTMRRINSGYGYYDL